jgi:ATP-binding cassette subfamily B protein
MTARLLAAMVGHRTRAVQQRAAEQHRGEDESLERYIRESKTMDTSSLWLMAAPRGWLIVALAAMTPWFVQGAPPSRLALAVGGLLLAYRALNRVTGGMASLSGAAIAAATVAPFARASMSEEPAPAPSMLLEPDRTAEAPDGLIAQATDVSFRYRPEGEPVLNGCSLRIDRGARFLLEGQSGSGKTTFASVLAGLNKPDSGLLLVDGLDRSVLGATGWRKRVVMAPQAHDNYLVTGSLAFNLLMGREWPADATALAEAESLCHELGLGDLLRRLPSGIHQVVGETGWQLSQGERVRVFLARALLQKPDLLVLDESFSALDPENVVRSIHCVLNRARTVLAIAHT